MKLVSVSEMQAIERQADSNGLSYAQMMENAGTNLANAVLEVCGRKADRSILGLVGSGNNGGDTLVALAFLATHGWRVAAYMVRPRPDDDPLMQRFLKTGGSYVEAFDDPDCRQLSTMLDEYAVLMDGVLRTGIHLPLRPNVAEVLGFAKRALSDLPGPPYVVAVDCPSGVDCDTGAAAEEVVPADMTVTMAAAKLGLLQFPAYGLIGNLTCVGIGSLKEMSAWESITREVVDRAWVRSRLPQRPLDAHKGTFGVAMVVAGCLNYSGAALLAGEAAYRIGVGWVTLAVPEPLHPILAGHLIEATWLRLPHEDGFISSDAVEFLQAHLTRPTALLLGPGLGLQATTAEFLERLLLSNGGDLPPLVLDADALKLISRQQDWYSKLPAPAILTPHPGEMAIISGIGLDEIRDNRLEVAERCAAEWEHVVVLKGANTIVAAPDGRTAVIAVATPALARAGTGDVLAGTITGLRAQGMDAFEAAACGVWIHAHAGLRAAASFNSTATVLAGDVLSALIDVMSDFSV